MITVYIDPTDYDKRDLDQLVRQCYVNGWRIWFKPVTR